MTLTRDQTQGKTPQEVGPQRACDAPPTAHLQPAEMAKLLIDDPAVCFHFL
jgi:hypothetical protein